MISKMNAEYRQDVARVVNEHYQEFCRIMTMPDEGAEFARELESSGFAMAQGSLNHNVMFWDDIKAKGENLNHPKYRIVAFDEG